MRDRGSPQPPPPDGAELQNNPSETEHSPEVRAALDDLRRRLDHPQSLIPYIQMSEPEEKAWHIIRQEYIANGQADVLGEKIVDSGRYGMIRWNSYSSARDYEGLNPDWRKFDKQDGAGETVVNRREAVTAEELQNQFPDYEADTEDWQKLANDHPKHASFFMIGGELRELPKGEEYNFEKIRDIFQSHLRTRIGEVASEEDKKHDRYLAQHSYSFVDLYSEKSRANAMAVSAELDRRGDPSTWEPEQIHRFVLMTADLICKYGRRPELLNGEEFFGYGSGHLPGSGDASYPTPFDGKNDGLRKLKEQWAAYEREKAQKEASQKREPEESVKVPEIPKTKEAPIETPLEPTEDKRGSAQEQAQEAQKVVPLTEPSPEPPRRHVEEPVPPATRPEQEESQVSPAQPKQKGRLGRFVVGLGASIKEMYKPRERTPEEMVYQNIGQVMRRLSRNMPKGERGEYIRRQYDDQGVSIWITGNHDSGLGFLEASLTDRENSCNISLDSRGEKGEWRLSLFRRLKSFDSDDSGSKQYAYGKAYDGDRLGDVPPEELHGALSTILEKLNKLDGEWDKSYEPKNPG